MDAKQIYVIGCNGYGYWVETNAKSLNAAKALATRKWGVCETSTLEVAIKHMDKECYEQVAVKDGYRRWANA